MNNNDIILVTVRGLDVPGITAKLTSVIAEEPGVRIIDIEQTVVHRKLLLSLLLKFARGRAEKTSVLKELLFAAKELGVGLDVEAFDAHFFERGRATYRYAITCLGSDIGARPLAGIATALAKRRVNIAKIARMSQNGLSCVELAVDLPKKLDHRLFTRELLSLASELDVDLAIQPADVSRRAKRLVVMDMDSTLVSSEAIDELAKLHGVGREVAAVTKLAMEGKIEFPESLKRRVQLLRGLPLIKVQRAVKAMKLTRGAPRLIAVLKALGYRIAVISGGFTLFADRLRDELELDYAFANQLEVSGGELTGKLVGEIIDGPKKAQLLEKIARQEKIALNQVIAVGDGANDLPMLSRAGMGIAFHAKEVVRKAAHASIGKHSGLDSLLYLLGISDEELRGFV